MRSPLKSGRWLVLAALLAAGPAWPADTLQLTTGAFQEIANADGTGKTLVPAAKVVPGGEVVYVITYRNVGAVPASKVVIDNPVPRELAYRDGSAGGAGARVLMSVDGGHSYGALAKLRVKGADSKLRPARGADVTHLRWTLPGAVKPGASGTVTYRATLK
jgi:uncharacterized repeat protein (TIGR01451 family)